MEVLGLLLLEINMWKIKCAENCQEVDVLMVEVTGSSKVNKSFRSEISQDGSFGNRT